MDRAKTLEAVKLLKKANQERLAQYHPSTKQAEFHAAGSWARERALLANNQGGKTFGAGHEVAYHLTGLYPDWWVGKRWDRPTHWWASSITNEVTRDNPQSKLMGQSKQDWGTGAIPKSCIDFKSITMARAGAADLIDTVRIKHASGGWSYLGFKSYNQGRDKWQGPTLDGVWFDEEPPQDIYSEGLTRTQMGTKASESESGIAILTCTPLLGMTEVIDQFYPEPNHSSRSLTQMNIWDLEGVLYSKDQIEAIVAGYPEHERDARSKGIPMRGSGRCYPVSDEQLAEEPFKIPPDWPCIAGIDLGYDHPTAVVHMALEPLPGTDQFKVHVYQCYAETQTTIVIHADYIKSCGDWIPMAWPHDAHKADPNSGRSTASLFREKGVNMLAKHATFPPTAGQDTGGYSVETGVLGILDMMKTGRFKIFSHLRGLLEEVRQYHRAAPKGIALDRTPKIVKRFDDRLDAMRYAFMMTRYAKVQQPRLTYSQPTSGMGWDPLNPGGGEKWEVLQ